MEIDRPMSWDQVFDEFKDRGEQIGRFLLSVGGSIAIAVALVLLARVFRGRIRAMAERRGLSNSVPSLIDNLIRIAVYIIVGIIVLSSLGIDGGSLVTFFGLATAAVTLSLQDVLKNIFSGIYLLAEQPFSPGDRIRVSGEEGRVERVDLRVTRIRNDRQELILVPNSTVFTTVVGTRSTMRFRPLTLQLVGIQQGMEPAEQQVRDVIAVELPGGSAPAIRLLQVGPAGCDLEITVRRTETDEQQRAIGAALNRSFPEATLSVIAR
jgi:ABC-type multidrug transport system fused ATPase/permease subunit